MSDQRPQDQGVTATYRRLAGERSPAHLDEAVLRMAASHAQHARYSRSVTWTRPLAWAATIALCLAITLELTRVPAPEEIVGVPAATDQSLHDAAPAAAEADLPATASPAPAGALQPQKLEVVTERREAFSEAKESGARARSNQADVAVAPAATFDLQSRDVDMLRQVEEMARLQNGSNNEPAIQETALAVTAGRAAATPCPDEARASPESWLQCIEMLEKNGDREAAAQQREFLIEVFPDFNLP